jgi:hypothetical protein
MRHLCPGINLMTVRELSAKVLGVALGVTFPLFRQIVERENRRHWAHGNAGAAVDALYGIDVEHFFGGELGVVLFGVDTVNRARIHASVVFGADARLCYDIGHDYVSPELLRNNIA